MRWSMIYSSLPRRDLCKDPHIAKEALGRNLLASMCLVLLVIASPFIPTSRALSHSYLPSHNIDITQLTLRSACVAMKTTPYTVPCNPAFAAFGIEPYFLGNLFLGNNYNTVREYRDLVTSQRYGDFIERLHKANREMEMQSATTLYFVAPRFNVSLAPEKLFYSSQVTNPTYPTFDIRIVREQAAAFQYGFEITPEWYWGLQTRLVSREFNVGHFSLFDALAGDPNIVRSDKQEAFFVEPGLAYVDDSPWHPRWTAMVSNLGASQTKDEKLKLDPVFDMGLGFQTPVNYWGLFDFGLSYRWLTGSNGDYLDPWRLGLIYQLGLVSVTAGYNKDSRALGVTSSFQKFRVGLLYENQRVINPQGIFDYENRVSTEFGLLL